MPPPAEEVESSAGLEDSPANAGGDVEMAEGADPTTAAKGTTENGGELPFAEEEVADARPTFMSYLMSPIINLSIGPPEANASLSAHQALLEQSPYFVEVCKNFVDDGSVSSPPSSQSFENTPSTAPADPIEFGI